VLLPFNQANYRIIHQHGTAMAEFLVTHSKSGLFEPQEAGRFISGSCAHLGDYLGNLAAIKFGTHLLLELIYVNYLPAVRCTLIFETSAQSPRSKLPMIHCPTSQTVAKADAK
jgi:hypothetical protein